MDINTAFVCVLACLIPAIFVIDCCLQIVWTIRDK